MVAVLANYRTPLRLFFAPNHAPWHADAIGAGRAQHDQRGNIQGDGWRLRQSGHAEFSLPRGAGGQGHSQFNSIGFYVTNRFFVTFFTEESNVSLVHPLPYTSTGTSARRRRLYSPPNRTGRPVISRRARAYQRS